MIFARARIFLLCLLCFSAPSLSHAAGSEDDATTRLKEIVETQKQLFAKAEAEGEKADQDELRSQLQQLVQQYDKLLAEHKDFVPAYVAYGLMLGKAGMSKEAVTFLLRANQLDGNLPIVKNQLGNYVAEEGRPLEAINYFLSAIKLDPEEPLYHYQLGMLLTEARDDFIKSGEWTRETVEETLHKAFERAMHLAPGDWRYAYQYGLSFYELDPGQWDAALKFWQDFEKTLKPGVEQEVCRLHQAKVLHELHRTDEARKLLASVNETALARQKDRVATEIEQPVAPKPAPVAPPAPAKKFSPPATEPGASAAPDWLAAPAPAHEPAK